MNPGDDLKSNPALPNPPERAFRLFDDQALAGSLTARLMQEHGYYRGLLEAALAELDRLDGDDECHLRDTLREALKRPSVLNDVPVAYGVKK